jgi:predicted DNA-binding WGR domain protein
MRRFELVEGSSSKFWEIELRGSDVDVRWGRIGTNGQSQTKSLGTEAKAQAQFDKLIKEKTGKGYAEVGVAEGASIAVSPPKAASAVATKKEAPASEEAAPEQAALDTTAPPQAVESPKATKSPVQKAMRMPSRSLVLTDPSTWPPHRRAQLHPRPAWTKDAPTLDRDAIWKRIRAAAGTEIRDAALKERLASTAAPTEPASIEVEMMLASALCAPRELRTISETLSLLIDHWTVSGGPTHALAALARMRLHVSGVFMHGSMSGWLRLAELLAPLSSEERKALTEVPGTRTLEFAQMRQMLFPELAEGDADVRSGKNQYASFASITTLAALDVAGASRSVFYFRSGQSQWSGSIKPMMTTWIATFGEAALEPIAKLLDVEGDSESTRELAELIAFIGTPRALEILASHAGDRLVLAALRDAALANPELALVPLVEQGLSRSPSAMSVRTILGQVLRSAGGALDPQIGELSDAGRKLVSELRLQHEGGEEASVSELPPLFTAPPWTTKKKRAATAVLELDPLPYEPSMAWPEGLRERWAHYAPQWTPRVDSPDYYFRVWGVPSELAAALAAGPDPAADEALRAIAAVRVAHRPSRVAASLPLILPRVAMKLLNAYASDAWWDPVSPLQKLAADHELLFLDALLAFASSHVAEGLEVLRPYGDPRIAMIAADALHKLKKKPPGASSWLRAHPEAAAVGLIPTAVGKPTRARDAAEQALRWLAKEGHESIVIDVAMRYGDAAKDAVRAVLDFDALDIHPSKMPAAPSFADAQALPRLVLENGKSLPPSAMQHVLTMLQISSLEVPYAGIEVINAITTRPSRETFAWELFSTWIVAGAPSKESWAFTAMGLLGHDECARRLTPLIRAWPGESQHQRAVTGLDVLASIGTDVALMHLHGIAQKLKFKGLQEKARLKIDAIAEARGFTAEELADRLVPDLGLDEDGSLTLDFGPRSFRVIFDEGLKPLVREESGKRLPDLPKARKDDDADKSAEATAIWKALKKDAKTLALGQVLRLELGMCARRRWSADVFETFLVKHPVMRHLVVRLAWATYDEEDRVTSVFRVAEDGTYANTDDDVFTLPEGATVGVAHTMEMRPEDQAKLGALFGDYELVQPFVQLGRETFALTEEEKASGEVTRWAGKKLPTGKVLGLEARGWRRGQPQDGGHISWIEKHVEGQMVSVSLDQGIAVGDVTMFPEQIIERLTCGDGWHPKKGPETLAKLHPIVMSELLRDIESLY